MGSYFVLFKKNLKYALLSPDLNRKIHECALKPRSKSKDSWTLSEVPIWIKKIVSPHFRPELNQMTRDPNSWRSDLNKRFENQIIQIGASERKRII